MLLGPEEGQKKAFLHKLIATLPHPEVHTFYAEETSIEDLAVSFYNRALFSHSVVLVYKNAEYLRSKGEKQRLTSYVRDNDASVLLVVESLQTTLPKGVEQIFPAARKKIFWELFESQKATYVARYCKEQGYHIENDAIQMIIQLAEGVTTSLKESVEQVCSVVLEKHITLEHVESYVYHSRYETIFRLFDFLAQKDFPSSLRVLDSLFRAHESAYNVVMRLFWQYQKVERIILLKQKGTSMAEALQMVGVHGKKYQATCVRLATTTKNIAYCLSIIAEADVLLRNLVEELQHETLRLLLYYLIVAPSGYLCVQQSEDLLFTVK